VRIDWYPLCIDLPGAHGTPETRGPREWAKVKYLYMDCRRIANKRGLTVKGTVKIYDPTLVSIAMLYAKQHGVFRRFHDSILPRFWNRDFDIEDLSVVKKALTEAGAPMEGFDTFVAGAGKAQFDEIQQRAQQQGVFGVPTFVYRDELFWGTDRVAMLRERLAQTQGR
jgi:2-hydroxychromene-2-carboxylate isomerase